MITTYKKTGETPLECLERTRTTNEISTDAPMTYAGRLDPMAEGVLLVLVGDECKDKEKYLDLDKEYGVEIAFGVETDTHDALGMATMIARADTLNSKDFDADAVNLSKYVGPFEQKYPPYSSKAVNGKQLHELARANDLPDEMPTKSVEIYSIELIDAGKISGHELKERIVRNINFVKGDFRQGEIVARWNELLAQAGSAIFPLIKIRVRCSSGTYMRSLADKIGEDTGMGAFALSIKRTRVGDFVYPISYSNHPLR